MVRNILLIIYIYTYKIIYIRITIWLTTFSNGFKPPTSNVVFFSDLGVWGSWEVPGSLGLWSESCLTESGGGIKLEVAFWVCFGGGVIHVKAIKWLAFGNVFKTFWKAPTPRVAYELHHGMKGKYFMNVLHFQERLELMNAFFSTSRSASPPLLQIMLERCDEMLAHSMKLILTIGWGPGFHAQRIAFPMASRLNFCCFCRTALETTSCNVWLRPAAVPRRRRLVFKSIPRCFKLNHFNFNIFPLFSIFLSLTPCSLAKMSMNWWDFLAMNGVKKRWSGCWLWHCPNFSRLGSAFFTVKLDCGNLEPVSDVKNMVKSRDGNMWRVVKKPDTLNMSDPCFLIKRPILDLRDPKLRSSAAGKHILSAAAKKFGLKAGKTHPKSAVNLRLPCFGFYT